ncbi:PAS domain-containing sensor histidine kinase [Gramella sp. KN1008]|uniref:PAS domain-containing sensor histidine kinase n=1 Tax=Gramella sp. KN1008 TaxID=2529298 RepID=UPI00103F0359|nr:PAS domain-containing sensor histidine kinase [Gramella sp. KN1008]TBW29234.1 PAS domain-containing sensor histidine kinase [Gramella sp. KN1008]
MDKELQIKELEKELAESRQEKLAVEEQLSFITAANNKLKEEIYQLKSLIYSSTALITFLKGPEHRIEFANDSIIKVWGKGSDVVGKPLFEVLPEIREQGIQGYLHQVYYQGEPYHARSLPVEHNVNGEMVKSFFDFSYMPQYNSQGKVIGVGVIAQDVTSQTKLHQKVKKSEKEFRELVDFMPHKISIADADGNPVFFNQSWVDYTGLNMEECLEAPWIKLIHPEHSKKFEDEMKESLKSGKDLDLELKIRNRSGDYKWHLHRAIAMKDDGIITSWISSSTEIQKLKEEEQRKQDFLKLVSHELKTPVTSIKGYVQLLQSIIQNDENNITKPYLYRIEGQVERLIRLISEMLDLSRIEKNELELNKENFSLNEHLENIIEDISYIHKDVQIELDHEYEGEVKADKDRIGQVIINFITNALKYSPDNKKVQIKIFKEERNMVGVSVRDFGIGIEQKDLTRIFQRFYRVSSENEKTYAGFGIGLYLSNEIIERHNGKIFVNSEPGEGSEFTFLIPLNHT